MSKLLLIDHLLLSPPSPAWKEKTIRELKPEFTLAFKLKRDSLSF